MKKLALILMLVLFMSSTLLAPQHTTYAASAACESLRSSPQTLTAPTGTSANVSYDLLGGEVITAVESWFGVSANNVTISELNTGAVIAGSVTPVTGAFTAPKDGSFIFSFTNPPGGPVPNARAIFSCDPAPYIEPYNPNLLRYGGASVGVDDTCITLYTTNDAQSVCDLPIDAPLENTQLIIIGKFRLYRLKTGEYQLNIGPDIEGKEQVIVFLIKPIRITKKYEFNLYQLGK